MGRVEVLGLFILCILIPSAPVVASSTVSCSLESDHVSAQGFSNQELTHHAAIHITENSHFRQLGIPGSGTYEDPYIIENLAIEDTIRCISISNTDAHFRINGCVLTCDSAEPETGPLVLDNVTNCVIQSCCMIGGDCGLYIRSCSSIDVLNNTMAGSNSSSLSIDDCRYDITVLNNRLFNSLVGIYMPNSESCIITLNRIYSNTFGIFIADGTQSNDILQNKVGWNIGSDGGVVMTRNAYDSGIDNYWDGNLWSDYKALQEPYWISGPADSQDNNPSSLYDWSPPNITASEMDRVIEGNLSAVLAWTIVEEFPLSYEIYQNSDIIDKGHLIGDIITCPLGSLRFGIYNFTILARDAIGSTVVLQCSINVVSPPVERSILFTIGLWACVVVILPLDYLRRVIERKKIEELEAKRLEESAFDICQLLE